MAKEWREPYCPVCGRGVGKRTILAVPGKAWTKIGERNYWAGLEPYDDFPFGLIKKSEGRGSLEIVREYSIDEDEEGYFPLIKGRLINVLEVWLKRGWLTVEDIASLSQT